MRFDMYTMIAALGLAVFAASAALTVRAEQYDATVAGAPDVLAIGGDVTEIVFALGQGHRLVARDSTSTWPEAATKLPDVGYMRRLSPEGVLSVAPGLILATEGAGPPETLRTLQQSGVAYAPVPEGYSAAAVAEKIRAVGRALHVPERADALVREVLAALDTARAEAEAREGPRQRVLFVLSLQGGKLMVSGAGTAADALIQMAGGVNAAQGFTGYKHVGHEAVLAMRPDAILVMDRSGNHGLDITDLMSFPALALSPAAQTGAVIRIDGLKALRFGPRVAEAVTELSLALYGGADDGS